MSSNIIKDRDYYKKPLKNHEMEQLLNTDSEDGLEISDLDDYGSDSESESSSSYSSDDDLPLSTYLKG